MLLIGSVAYAQDDQIIVGGGIGVFHSADRGLSETKMLSLGVQEDFWGAIKTRGTVGGWLDNSGPPKSDSGFVSGQMGWEVNRDGLIAGAFTGPAIISNTDSLLGGHFQFMDDLHLGIQDKEGNYIGVMYRHFSSAGLATPNIGRDIVGLEFRF
jgi:hypothetical protein